MSIANELITRGWTQGTYEDSEGRVCLRTAARYAYDCGDDRLFARASAALAEACGEENVIPGLIFNDAPGRTFDEVLRVAKEVDELMDAS